MKNLLIALLLGVMFVSTASAQDVKTVSWSEFWRGVEFGQQSNGEWEFTHAGRAIHLYTFVEIPAGALSIKNLFRITSSSGYALYLVILNTASPIQFGKRDVSIRATYTCRLVNDKECRGELSARLLAGTKVHSTGVADSDLYKKVLCQKLQSSHST